MRMYSADNRDILILGATIFRLSGRDQSGNERVARQMVYITNNTDKLCLSREACMDLGIIPTQFPIVGEIPPRVDHQVLSIDHASFSQEVASLKCDCPRRTKPPPLPTTLPCA